MRKMRDGARKRVDHAEVQAGESGCETEESCCGKILKVRLMELEMAVLTFSLGFFSVLRRFWDMKYGLSADPSLRSRSSTGGRTIKSEPKSVNNNSVNL
ncbi:hypothetical protein SRHO_G00335070 [Serrasalmus rhombeus]